MNLIGNLSKYDKIQAYMTNPDAVITDLSEHEREMLDRWQEAYTMQRKYTSVSDTVAILMKRFPGLSKATAYRDCRDSMNLFGDIIKAKKDAMRNLALEMVKDGARIANAEKDSKGLIRAGLAIARIAGVNVTDPDLPDFSKWEPHQYVLGLDKGLVNMLRAMTKSGRIDLSQVVTNMGNIADDAVEVSDES